MPVKRGYPVKKNILVIDDDPLVREMLVEVLGGEGYEALASLNFEDALQKARQTLPDLVLIAADQENLSGFDGCRQIKELFKPHPPLVIVMTGKLNMVDPIRARRMGADDFVVKTSDMANLIQGVMRAFSL